jgi:hypothetical protein
MNEFTAAEIRSSEVALLIASGDQNGQACFRCGSEMNDGFRGFVQLVASTTTYSAYSQLVDMPLETFAGSRCFCHRCFRRIADFVAGKQSPDVFEKISPDRLEALVEAGDNAS